MGLDSEATRHRLATGPGSPLSTRPTMLFRGLSAVPGDVLVGGGSGGSTLRTFERVCCRSSKVQGRMEMFMEWIDSYINLS